jgi:hypothetical protein
MNLIAYIFISLIALVGMNKLGGMLARRNKKMLFVCLYLLLASGMAAVHYRFFKYDDVAGVQLGEGVWVDLISLFFCLSCCIVSARDYNRMTRK